MTSFSASCDDEVLARLESLRDAALDSPDSAAEAAWQWLDELTTLHSTDKSLALNKLATIFEYGARPRLDGAAEGRILAWCLPLGLEEVFNLVTSVWMPWQGKVFDAESGKGMNLLSDDARWPAKVLWPRYSTHGSEHGRLAFQFETRYEPGILDAETDVLAVDYKPVEGNPALVVSKVRDEYVEVVPGTYLGKILYRNGQTYSLVAYVALRTPATELE